MGSRRRALALAAVFVGLTTGCSSGSDDGSDAAETTTAATAATDPELVGRPAAVATGVLFIAVGGEPEFCVALTDGGPGPTCAGHRVLLQPGILDKLEAAGVGFDDDDGAVADNRVTLRLEGLSLGEPDDFFRADAELVEVAEPHPSAPEWFYEDELEGTGTLVIGESSAEALSEELDALARRISPAGTVSIWHGMGSSLEPDDAEPAVDGPQDFGVRTLLPLSDEGRALLLATLGGSIAVHSWASFPDG